MNIKELKTIIFRSKKSNFTEFSKNIRDWYAENKKKEKLLKEKKELEYRERFS